jgi:hypothetical protein
MSKPTIIIKTVEDMYRSIEEMINQIHSQYDNDVQASSSIRRSVIEGLIMGAGGSLKNNIGIFSAAMANNKFKKAL